jgi:hypothetical protein
MERAATRPPVSPTVHLVPGLTTGAENRGRVESRVENRGRVESRVENRDPERSRRIGDTPTDGSGKTDGNGRLRSISTNAQRH